MSEAYSEERTPLLIEFTTIEEGIQQVSYRHQDLDELTEKSNKAIDKALSAIQGMAQRVNSSIRNIDGRPDHVEVDFGIKFDAEVGIIIAKASMEANLNVKLTWDNLGKLQPLTGST